jgi:hypothetical protein
VDKTEDEVATFVFATIDAQQLATASPAPRPTVAAEIVDRQRTLRTI